MPKISLDMPSEIVADLKNHVGDSKKFVSLADAIRTACRKMETGHRTVILPFIPTAENLAKWAFEQVEPHISTSYGNSLVLRAFHVRETPKSWASWFDE